jgi:hypothetical protein
MIYFISVLVLIVSYSLFKKASGSMALNKLNMISLIFYYYLVLMSYLGSTFIANGFGENSVINLISSETRLLGWVVISYVMIALPMGILLVKHIYKVNNVAYLYERYIHLPVVPLISKKDSSLRIVLYGLTLLCFFSAIYMILVTGYIPQTKLFNLHSQADVLLLRNGIDRDFKGFYPIKSILFEQMTPLLSYVSYAYYKMTHSLKDKIWFYSLLLLSLFMLTFALAKSPLISYGIIFLVLKIYIDGAMKWKYFIAFLVFAILGIALMFVLIVRGENLEFVLIFLFNRIFFDQVSGSFLMLQIFPDVYNYLGFSSLSRPLNNLLGSFSEPATRLAMEYVFPAATAEGTMSLLSTLFIGEAWANFGWAGIIISPIYIGIVVGVFYYFILKSKKTPVLVGFLAFFSFNVNLNAQFNQYIYNSPVFLLIIIFILSYVMALIMKQN